MFIYFDHIQNTTHGRIFDCTPTLGEAFADLYHKGPSNDKEVVFDSTPKVKVSIRVFVTYSFDRNALCHRKVICYE